MVLFSRLKLRMCHMTNAGTGPVGAPGQRLNVGLSLLMLIVSFSFFLCQSSLWSIIVTSFTEHCSVCVYYRQDRCSGCFSYIMLITLYVIFHPTFKDELPCYGFIFYLYYIIIIPDIYCLSKYMTSNISISSCCVA